MKYTKEKLEDMVKQVDSIQKLIVALGLRPSGGNHAHISKLVKKYNIDTSHFYTSKNPKPPCFKYKPEDVLVKDKFTNRRLSAVLLRRVLIECGKKYECEKCCNSGIWMDQDLMLQVDHINGDWTDNTIDNLRFLCPNCHTQTKNYGNKSEDGKQKTGITCIQYTYKKTKKCLDCENFCAKSSKRCIVCAKKSHNHKTFCKRPPKEDLINDLSNIKIMTKIGEKHNVSDNTVRKWIKFYKIGEYYINNRKRN